MTAQHTPTILPTINHPVDMIPGTEVMLESSHPDTIELIPKPSNSPLDPLNWSNKWKYAAIFTQSLFCIVSVMCALSLSPMSSLVGAEFDLTPPQVGLLTGVCVITLGYSNFLVVPFTNIFGRRATSLIFGTMSIGSTIWQATAKTHASLMGARVFNAFAASTTEALMMQVVADMFFLHERGLWTGVYFTSYFMGLYLGPVISGNIAARFGWRSFFWLATGLSILCLILLFFLFPETKFKRKSSVQDITPAGSDVTPPTLDDFEISKETPGHIEDQSAAVLPEACANDFEGLLRGTGKPSMAQFKLISRPDKNWKAFLVKDIIAPIRCFALPIVFWAGMILAGSVNCILLFNLTLPITLGAPPYNWNESQIGYANFAFVVGGLIGLFTAGSFSDWVAARATRRNGGIREAEMRLPALIPYVIITAIGLIVGGVGFTQHWNWEIILVFCYGSIGISLSSVPTIAIAYAVDSYKQIAGEIMCVATVFKNTCGFAMSYWVFSQIALGGMIRPAMIQLALFLGPAALTIPLYYWGKNLRRLTRNSPWHKMSEI